MWLSAVKLFQKQTRLRDRESDEVLSGSRGFGCRAVPVGAREKKSSRTAIKYSVVYYAVTFKKNNQVYLFFSFFLNVDVCDAEEYESCRTIMCSLESCLSAGVTIYWQMWVTDNITSLLHKKKNSFGKVCVRATSRGLWADAGRPELSHRGKVINLLYIDVVLLVIGLWEIISALHAASGAAMCLYVSDLRSGLYIFWSKSLCCFCKTCRCFPLCSPPQYYGDISQQRLKWKGYF